MFGNEFLVFGLLLTSGLAAVALVLARRLARRLVRRFMRRVDAAPVRRH